MFHLFMNLYLRQVHGIYEKINDDFIIFQLLIVRYPNGQSGHLVIEVVVKVFNPGRDSLFSTRHQVESDVPLCPKTGLAWEIGAQQLTRSIKILS